MTTAFQRYRNLLMFIVVVLGLYSAGVFIAITADPIPRETIASIALPFDFMIFIPALFYLFIVRKYDLTPLLVIPVIWFGGLLVTQVAQPQSIQFITTLFVITITVEVGIAIREIVRITRSFKEARQSSHDPLEWFSRPVLMLTKNRRVAKLLSMECATMYYALFSWRKKASTTNGVEQVFSYHTQSGYSALVGALVLISMIEIPVVHLLISQWSLLFAWVMTGLSGYFMIWLFGDMRASMLRPVRVGAQYVEVYSGLRFSVKIPRALIESVSSVDPQLAKEHTVNVGMMGACNCWLLLSEAIETESFLGKKRSTKAIGLTLDDAAAFRKALCP